MPLSYGKTENAIRALIAFANVHLSLPQSDNSYYFNILCGILRVRPAVKFSASSDYSALETLDTPDEILGVLCDRAVETGLIDADEIPVFAPFLTAVVMPSPSRTAALFNGLIEDGGVETATRWFYNLNLKSGHIPADGREKIKWRHRGGKGELDVTINPVKPEKTRLETAAEPSAATGYMRCPICAETEGFFGNFHIQPRQTMRALPIRLADGNWFFYYSPFNYFNEHFVVMSARHEPMRTDAGVLAALFDFTDRFPHYFIGSNADLPLVGGSAPAHEHFQGGMQDMPLFRARPRAEFTDFRRRVTVSITDWYCSCVRVEGGDRHAVITAANEIISGWFAYSNPKLYIINEPDGRHNAAALLARKNGGTYYAEIILRNNYADESRPGGAFDTDPKYFNIKRGGIGLIEAAGAFILPSRIAAELRAVRGYSTDAEVFDYDAFKSSPAGIRADTTRDLLKPQCESENEADGRLKSHIGAVCADILRNISVFSDDAAGNYAFAEFITCLDFDKK